MEPSLEPKETTRLLLSSTTSGDLNHYGFSVPTSDLGGDKFMGID
jgi:hypothetical protein